MREFSMKDLKPTRTQLIKINKYLISQREQKINATSNKKLSKDRIELIKRISINNWDKLVKQGKIIELGHRHWAMEWDI